MIRRKTSGPKNVQYTSTPCERCMSTSFHSFGFLSSSNPTLNKSVQNKQPLKFCALFPNHVGKRLMTSGIHSPLEGIVAVSASRKCCTEISREFVKGREVIFFFFFRKARSHPAHLNHRLVVLQTDLVHPMMRKISFRWSADHLL